MPNQLKTVLLLGALSGLLVMIGGALGPRGLYLFTGLALLMNLGAYFFSDKLVLAMHRARQVSPSEEPGLHRVIGELAYSAGLPMPRVYVLPEMQPNAFATGRNPEKGVVAVTQGLMRLLDERELRGVIAHELSHIKNRDILVATIAAGIATAITHIAHMVQLGAIFGGGRSDDEDGSPLGGLAMAFIAPLAAMLIQLGISRSREYLADESAARITRDPEGLARALMKLQTGAERMPPSVDQPATASLFIVSPFAGMGRSLFSLFSTHPSIESRVERLRTLQGLSSDATVPA